MNKQEIQSKTVMFDVAVNSTLFRINEFISAAEMCET